MNEGATVEAQLITLLGFVVIQSFHSSLRLSGGKQKRKGQAPDMSRGKRLYSLAHLVLLLREQRLQSRVTAPSAGKAQALRRLHSLETTREYRW